MHTLKLRDLCEDGLYDDTGLALRVRPLEICFSKLLHYHSLHNLSKLPPKNVTVHNAGITPMDVKSFYTLPKLDHLKVENFSTQISHDPIFLARKLSLVLQSWSFLSLGTRRMGPVFKISFKNTQHSKNSHGIWEVLRFFAIGHRLVSLRL
jgi:hypothetical protein